jgi:hypothetical protein
VPVLIVRCLRGLEVKEIQVIPKGKEATAGVNLSLEHLRDQDKMSGYWLCDPYEP